MTSELPGFPYLYTLSTVVMTFMTFTLIYLFVRQATGQSFNKWDMFITREYVKVSLIIVAGTLLPPLIYNLTYYPTLTWRLSSGLVALMLIENYVSFLRDRKRVTATKLSMRIIVAAGLHLFAIVILITNTVGASMAGGSRLFIVSVTLPFFATLLAVLGRFDAAYDASYQPLTNDVPPQPPRPAL